MNLQAQLIRATVLLASTLIALGVIAFQQPHNAMAQPPVATVHPAPKIIAGSAVTLPTIHVCPTTAQLAQAVVHSTASGPITSGPITSGPITSGPITSGPITVAAPGTLRDTNDDNHAYLRAITRMDMPYYSFGKVLPRIGSKE